MTTAATKLLKPIKGNKVVYRRWITKGKYGTTINIEKISAKSKRALDREYKKLLEEYEHESATRASPED